VPGEPVSTLGVFDLGGLGYLATEWFLAGTANSWRSAGELGDDGRWAVEAAGAAPFQTRLLACVPADPLRFNGTVVVEWLNVSGGGDGSPDWFFLHRHLMREGAAWVGVSAQKAGIDGGGLFDRCRLWEIAGAAHFDTYGLVAAHHDDGTLPVPELAAMLAPTDQVLGQKAASLVNSGPQQHYVLNAAIAHLRTWVRQGSPPPSADRLETTEGDDPVLALDELGIARGGLRTPWVDAPVAVLSGLGQEGAVFTALFGVTRPLDAAQLHRLYPSGREQYLAAFERCLDEAIASGFILEADRAEILALSAAARPFAVVSG
jgi:hypothetical protein